MLYLDYSRKEGEWIPNQYGGRENLEAIEFLRAFNHITHVEFPGVITVAEESTAYLQVTRPTYIGGLGFTFKWNMGWMHDTLWNYFRPRTHPQISCQLTISRSRCCIITTRISSCRFRTMKSCTA